MRAFRLWLGLLGTLALAGLPAPAGAQAVGSEFQVNTYTTGNQRTRHRGGHQVAADASGNLVVVWDGLGQDGYGVGVFGQRYDSEGVAQGAEFRVNSNTLIAQVFPAVASDASGNFVVVWQGTPGGSYADVLGQRYDSAGAPVGPEFGVNVFTTGLQGWPSVASDASGNWVAVWVSRGQDGSTMGVFGGAGGGDFQVNSYTTAYQSYPVVASDADGDFVVVWSSDIQDYNTGGVFGQRYDRNWVPQGDEFRVNSYTTSYQGLPSVASDASGNFVVVWASDQDGNTHGVFGQRYDSDGGPLGSEFRVNSYTTGFQNFPSVASDADGNFLVTWQSNGQDGQDGFESGIFGQYYANSGIAQGGEFQINSFTTNSQSYPHVWATGISQFVVVWTSELQDGSGSGVFGQRFDFAGLPSLSISDASVTEGNLPRSLVGKFAVFAVSLSAPSTQPVAIDYATANGTATAPSDYTAKSGTLTLSPGQTSGRIAVRVREDNVPEGDETFFVNLSNPTNATIADGQGVGTILNDDP